MPFRASLNHSLKNGTTKSRSRCAVWKEIRRRVGPGSRFLSKHGRHGRFHPYPRNCVARALLPAISPSPPQPWITRRPRRSETQFNYRCSQKRRGRLLQRFLNRLLCERSHDSESSLVRMQPIFREVAFQHAFVVHDGAEVVEVNEMVPGGVVFQPII